MTDNNSLRTKKMQVLSGLDFGTLPLYFSWTLFLCCVCEKIKPNNYVSLCLILGSGH